MSLAPEFCSWAALTADTATGTSASACARPCAVTTTSPEATSSCVCASCVTAAFSVPDAVAGVVFSGAVFCAKAGVASPVTIAVNAHAVSSRIFINILP